MKKTIQVAPNDGGVTVSHLFSTGPGKLLVPEHLTDKLYQVNVAGATDLTTLEDATGKLLSDPTTRLH